MAASIVKARNIRVPDPLWDKFSKRAVAEGGKGSVIRRLITLYLRDPDLRMKVTTVKDAVLDRNPNR